MAVARSMGERARWSRLACVATGCYNPSCVASDQPHERASPVTPAATLFVFKRTVARVGASRQVSPCSLAPLPRSPRCLRPSPSPRYSVPLTPPRPPGRRRAFPSTTASMLAFQ
eukprot:scaffold85540_cov63-Phaeocystis_antarctica.AAC.2